MKKRRFPFGYEIRNGSIAVCTGESIIVSRIFNEYLEGANLITIAESLTKQRIEYLPGEFAWNKNRIKRMIEETRYIGDKEFPPIISVETFKKANLAKEDRRKNASPKVTSENKNLVSKMICGECGGRLYHNTDTSKTHSEMWHCKNKGCGAGRYKTIEDIEKETTVILNQLIKTPSLAEVPERERDIEPSLELQRMENEVERKLDSLDIEQNTLKEMILQCASIKYKLYKSTRHITDGIKADYEKSSPLSIFPTGLFDRTVNAVILDKNRTVRLKLKNNKIVEKEGNNDSVARSILT